MTYQFNKTFTKEEFSDGDVMIYDTANETMHILNKTAAWVLELVQQFELPKAKETFISSILTGENNEISPAEIETDFDSLVEDMEEKWIIVSGNTAG